MAFGIRGGVLLALLCVSLPLGVSATPTFTTERTLEEIPPSSMPGGVGSPVEAARLPLYRAHALAALDALNDARGNGEEVYTLGDVLEARTQVVAGELSPTIHQHPTIREKAPSTSADPSFQIPNLAGTMVHVKYQAMRGDVATVCRAKVWQKLDGTIEVTSNSCEEETR
jgi:hypothetical protein